MSDEKLHLLQTHPASRGLDAEALREIAESLELVRLESGAQLHRANERLRSVFLLARGRLRVIVLDSGGDPILEREILPGEQFGGVAAVMEEPAPVDCVAMEPTTMLKLDRDRGIELFQRFPLLRANFIQLVAQSVKQAIQRERHPHKPLGVGFFHQSPATRPITAKLFDRLAGLGEVLHVLSDQPGVEASQKIRFHPIVSEDRPITAAELRQQVPQWLREGRVFGDVAASIDLSRAIAAFETFVQIYWCVSPENWQDSMPRLSEILSRSPTWRDKITVVWLLSREQRAPLAPELRALVSRDVKIVLDEPVQRQDAALAGGLERLVHLVRGVQIGVALGGGAARGMAHLGVLKALEQRGITVDMIAGTSAGAMTGTVYASGMDVDFAIERFVHDLRPSRFFRMLPKGDQWYLLYKYRTRQFDPMLRKYLHDACYEQLPIPMHAITLDLISGKAVERDRGDAVQGIVESINLPVLSIPINRDGQSLVDGGLIDNVPADVLARRGCNYVIAVSVTAKMETEFVRNRPDTPTHQMRPASVIQTLLRSYLVQSVNINALGVEPADIVIEPDVTQFQLTEFTRTDELAAIGEQATLAAMDQIRKDLHRLDPQLFPLPAE
jgi:predicted acylesterase/phospholipase RssA/CRP-like cAMP-binding protein